MNDFYLKKDNKKKKVLDLKMPLDGFHMKPRLKKHESLIEIKEIVIVKDDLKNHFLQNLFNRTFRKLIAIMIDVTDSENTTSSDCAIALNEVAKARSMLEQKLAKELKKKEYTKLEKKLALVEEKIQKKLLEIRTNEMLKNMINVPNYEEELEKGRGR